MSKLESIKAWYFNLPWWGKVIGVGVLIILGLLSVLVYVFRSKSPESEILEELDTQHEEQIDQELKQLEDENKNIKKSIEQAKKEVYKKINLAGTIDAETLKNRKAVEAAETMEDLDEIQKRLGL
jgi:uncharacterized membrane protein